MCQLRKLFRQSILSSIFMLFHRSLNLFSGEVYASVCTSKFCKMKSRARLSLLTFRLKWGKYTVKLCVRTAREEEAFSVKSEKWPKANIFTWMCWFSLCFQFHHFLSHLLYRGETPMFALAQMIAMKRCSSVNMNMCVCVCWWCGCFLWCLVNAPMPINTHPVSLDSCSQAKFVFDS